MNEPTVLIRKQDPETTVVDRWNDIRIERKRRRKKPSDMFDAIVGLWIDIAQQYLEKRDVQRTTWALSIARKFAYDYMTPSQKRICNA